MEEGKDPRDTTVTRPSLLLSTTRNQIQQLTWNSFPFLDSTPYFTMVSSLPTTSSSSK